MNTLKVTCSVEDLSFLKEASKGLKSQIRPGDSKILWNANDPDEVEKARETFKRVMEKLKGTAYRKLHNGKTEKIKEIDPNAEEIIIVEQQVGG